MSDRKQSMSRYSLFALVDAYHDAEEQDDDLTCMAAYDEAMKHYSLDEWRNMYNVAWKIRMESSTRKKGKVKP